MVSLKLRLIFIHVPKCAGTSVVNTIRLLDPDVTHGHVGWNAYNTAEYDGYFRFAIVRNPWDRVLACYRYARTERNYWHDNIGGKNVHPDYDHLRTRSFEWCIRDLFYHKEELNRPARLRSHYRYHWDHQWTYVFDGNRQQKVDELLQFEKLPACFDDIRSRFGIGALRFENASRPVYGGTYQDYYNAKTRDMVRGIYARDIEWLGYEF